MCYSGVKTCLMFCVALIEGVHFERTLTLDYSHNIAGEGEQVALLLADAAVALAGCLDLCYLQLEDEGATMAVATVGLQVFSFGHIVLSCEK
jgi:hypothetical protein